MQGSTVAGLCAPSGKTLAHAGSQVKTRDQRGREDGAENTHHGAVYDARDARPPDVLPNDAND